MTVNVMLFHCRKINKNILQGKEQNQKPTPKQRIVKIIGLYLMKEFPKGIKTGPNYLPEPADNLNFDEIKIQLIDSIKEVASYEKDIFGNHPFFGPLNTNEWRRFIWKHLDHHLRQFQV